MEKNIIKKYSNGEITVVWQPKMCVHSANCVRSLPLVFNTKQSPWIQIDKARTAEIINAVTNCPSGALSIIYNEEETK